MAILFCLRSMMPSVKLSISTIKLFKKQRVKRHEMACYFNQKKDRNGKIKINISEKKVIYLNNIKIKKLSELLGKINIVI